MNIKTRDIPKAYDWYIKNKRYTYMAPDRMRCILRQMAEHYEQTEKNVHLKRVEKILVKL